MPPNFTPGHGPLYPRYGQILASQGKGEEQRPLDSSFKTLVEEKPVDEYTCVEIGAPGSRKPSTALEAVGNLGGLNAGEVAIYVSGDGKITALSKPGDLPDLVQPGEEFCKRVENP